MKKQIVKRVPAETAPPEKEIVFCISLYFGIPPIFSRQNIFFKQYLNEIANKRNFLATIEDRLEREIFIIYLTTRIPKVEISKMKTNKCHWGQSIINKNIKRLVNEIMTDYKAGTLKEVEYIKPLTRTQELQKINEFCKKNEIPIKLPLRDPSLKEYVSARNKKKELLT